MTSAGCTQNVPCTGWVAAHLPDLGRSIRNRAELRLDRISQQDIDIHDVMQGWSFADLQDRVRYLLWRARRGCLGRHRGSP